MPKEERLYPQLNEEIRGSEIYESLGIVNIQKEKYLCNIVFLVSASPDIDAPKVIDFLKDYIPSQFDEISQGGKSEKYLELFEDINKSIADVLAGTLEADSFIDVHLAYVLIENNFFYTSLDEDFNIIIKREKNKFPIKKGHSDNVNGSGLLEPEDTLLLTYKNQEILSWIKEEPESDQTILAETQNLDSENTEMTENDYSDLIANPDEVEKSDYLNDELEEDNTSNSLGEEGATEDFEEQEEYAAERSPRAVSSHMEKVKEYAQKLKHHSVKSLNHLSPKIKIYAKKASIYVGDAVSYLIALIFRKNRGAGKALPHKKKGFLILAGAVFLVILLSVLIKGAVDDNQRKQEDQKFKEQVSQVGKSITVVQAQSASISIGDTTIKSKIADLRAQVKQVEDSPLKSRVDVSSDVKSYKTILDSLDDRVNGITRIDESAVLTRFGGSLTNPNPTSLSSVRDGKIYFSDLTNKKIKEVDTNTGYMPDTDVVSDQQGLLNPQAVELSKSSLLVLDTSKGVFSINLATKASKLLAGYDALTPGSTTIKTYYDADVDNFYILQPGKKQILRIPGVNGAFQVSSKYKPDEFEEGLEDFTIIDGKIYTVNKSGQINKYNRVNATRTDQEIFTLSGLSTPIGPGARIAGMGARDVGNAYFFVSDPSNNRVVVFDNNNKDGIAQFVTQYVPKAGEVFDFKSLSAISFDENGGKVSLYLLSKYGILKVNVG